MTPPEIRGKVMSMWQTFYSVGAFIAYWVAYACTKHADVLGEWDWKMVVIFQMLVPLIIISQLPFLPESPRVSYYSSPRLFLENRVVLSTVVLLTLGSFSGTFNMATALMMLEPPSDEFVVRNKK